MTSHPWRSGSFGSRNKSFPISLPWWFPSLLPRSAAMKTIPNRTTLFVTPVRHSAAERQRHEPVRERLTQMIIQFELRRRGKRALWKH